MGSRDTLGLLLPLPALLLAGSAQARVPSPQGEDRGLAEPGPAEPAPMEPGGPAQLAAPSVDALPAEVRAKVEAFYLAGTEAFDRGDFRDAGLAFEQAATLAPLPRLYLEAAVAFRHAAMAEPDTELAGELSDAARHNADAVMAHPQATAEQVAQAQAEATQVETLWLERLETMATPCLSVMNTNPDIGPCLSVMEDPRGCGRRGDGSVAMLGALALVGLRARRRRDAVERLAERLPPDVVAKLRRRSDDGADEGR